ncbi:sensor histidine kinase [Raoultibacter phocaeensis]|uniref:sensor histidine kinase n=1 Tax=Raoultibacter phocaeensis TaxID=2479841 RepID=UPI00111AEA24|nr:sensor histidine kinase [Raoultibacter phocaeensis]
MKVSEYLADRAVELAVQVLVIVLVSWMLAVLDVGVAAIVFLAGILSASLVFSIVYGYVRRRRFYDELESVVAALAERSESFLAAELLGRPSFLEGRIAYDALGVAGKSMNDEVARYRALADSYREYVETWIHEIKTPIAAAKLMASGLHGVQADKIKAEIGRVEGYVEQALYYARSTSLQKDYSIRETGLAACVRESVKKNAQLLIGAGVGVSVDIDDAATVFADAKWLQFVIGQVLANSARYDATTFTASARIEGEGTVHARTVLELADDGCGIAAADIDSVFEKGFTGQNGRTHGSSTGMGLYLCSVMCAEMGLGLGIASEEGKGTRVMIAFPHDRRRIDALR